MTIGAFFIPMDVQKMLMLRSAREQVRNRLITKRTYREIRAEIHEYFARAKWWDSVPVRTAPVRRQYTRKQIRKMLQKAGRV